MKVVEPSYTAAIASLAERLAPGGELEKSLLGSVDKQTTMLANSMEGANIARGLGNATLGVAPTASRVGMEQKQSVRNSLLGQYLSTLQFLSGAQAQQRGLNLQSRSLDLQQQSLAANASNSRLGLDAFGKPLSGSLAEAELQMAQRRMNAAANPAATPPSASSYGSLYSSGGGVNLDFGQNPYGSVRSDSAPASADSIEWGTPIYGDPRYQGF